MFNRSYEIHGVSVHRKLYLEADALSLQVKYPNKNGIGRNHDGDELHVPPTCDVLSSVQAPVTDGKNAHSDLVSGYDEDRL